MVDATRIHQGSCISIFRYLPSLKGVKLPGSPEHHPSVVLGVQEDSGGSWEESWRFLTWLMSQGYIKEAAYQFSDLYLTGKCSIFNLSPERNHGVKEAAYQFSDLLYPPGKWFNSWVLQSIDQVLSLESKRMLEVPERSLGGFWHNGCPKDI